MKFAAIIRDENKVLKLAAAYGSEKVSAVALHVFHSQGQAITAKQIESVSRYVERRGMPYDHEIDQAVAKYIGQ